MREIVVSRRTAQFKLLKAFMSSETNGGFLRRFQDHVLRKGPMLFKFASALLERFAPRVQWEVKVRRGAVAGDLFVLFVGNGVPLLRVVNRDTMSVSERDWPRQVPVRYRKEVDRALIEFLRNERKCLPLA